MPVISRQGHQFPGLHFQREETGDLQRDCHSALQHKGDYIVQVADVTIVIRYLFLLK